MAADPTTIATTLQSQIQQWFDDNWEGDEVEIELEYLDLDEVPEGGRLNIFIGDPGQPDDVLGGFDTAFYSHTFEIDIIVISGASNTRMTKFGALSAALGAALISDRTLGGLVAGITFGQPAPANERVIGGEDMKASTLLITVDYQSDAPIPTV